MPEEVTNDEQDLRQGEDAQTDVAPEHSLSEDDLQVLRASDDSNSDLAVELAEANGRALRAQAELENFRKRMRREMDEQQRYAATPLVRELLSVVDDLERAIVAAEQSEDKAGLLAGVKMVEDRLRLVLGQHGCQKIEADGATFDPAQHEAILHQPSDEHEPGAVMQVTQQGYQLHDRVIRPAQVIVAKEPSAPETKAE